MIDRTTPIIVEHSSNKDIETVWAAITERDQMVQWFFENIEAFEPRMDFTTSFDVQSGDRNFNHQWRILEVIPFQKIVYHWSYAEYPGEGRVTFELLPQGEKTLIRLTNTGLDSFPADLPEFTRESCLGGWNYFIKERLANYLQ
ncbi:SRPBCC domain-containing protein [Puteibacter caeruleilacunae]|nr:SRPBCC domain-containing protein [Puteibacter caeruleilacunae]